MKIPALTALLAGSALALAACGGATSSATTGSASNGGTNGGTNGGSTAGNVAAPSGSGLHVASTSLGKVLVDRNGMTVYLLTADGRDHSTCSSDCLALWPAVTPGHSKLPVPVATTKTPAGTPTATVAGQPVYTFANDHGPGDVNGEGLQAFGGTWYAVSPTGQAVTASSNPSPGGSSSSTSGGSSPYGGGGY